MLSSIVLYSDNFHYGMNGSLSLDMTRSARRGPWLPEEDNTLLQLVRTQGANNWVRISQQLQHRSPKQCRERYHQNLKPSLKHDPISAQEGEVIEQLVQEMGRRWAEIARRLGNRSDNAVKNWWNGSVNRRKRNPTQATTGLKQVGTRLQPIPFTLPPDRTNSTFQKPHLGHNKNDNYADQQPRRITRQYQRHQPSQTPSSIHPPTPSTMGSSTGHPHNNLVPSQNLPPSISTHPTRPPMPQVASSESRHPLPPLRSSSLHVPIGERPSFAMEVPPISPALSDNSQWQQPPSLMSDSQSFYSISPRHVTTPRSGIPAPVEVGASTWSENRNSAQYAAHPQPYNTLEETKEGSDSAKYTNSTDNRIPPSISNDERSRDSRMNVATLLQ